MIGSPALCPDHLQNSLFAYRDHGRPVGSFLRACLENDLLGAVSHADVDNLPLIASVVSFIWHELPSESWGSPDRVREWIESHREYLLIPSNAGGEL